jgi:uncharacterized protein with HEPN domain
MPAPDPTDYLQDILEEAENSRQFVQGMSVDAFTADIRTPYAVRLAIAHMGEA